MRQPRIKFDALLGPGVYHCSSRTVNGERLIKDLGPEMLRKIIWQVAEGLGLEVLTYVILSSHFHVYVLVPIKGPISDEELLRRFSILYPNPTRYRTRQIEVIRQQLATNGPEAVKWREKMLKLMNDVSQFMKLVKQRFTIWYNRNHNRFGTLWAERFKSGLTENKPNILRIVAAYVDLNPVRAGMVGDPKDFRFCGYAEAVAGHEAARRGIMLATGVQDWKEAQAAYRQVLYSTGSDPRENAASFTAEQLDKVLREGGRLSLPTVLRCRIRHFSDGAILGSHAFVAEQLIAYRAKTKRDQRTKPHPMPAIADWGDMTTLRSLRGQAIG